MKRIFLYCRIIILVLITFATNDIWGRVPRVLAEAIPSMPCYYSPSDININTMIESRSFSCSIETNNVSDTIAIFVQSIYDLNKKSYCFFVCLGGMTHVVINLILYGLKIRKNI